MSQTAIRIKNDAPALKGKATDLSICLAERLHEIRVEMKLSQRAMAEMLGISFQQYQKYEKAKDRISLERAVVLCYKLDIPLCYLDVLKDCNHLKQYKDYSGLISHIAKQQKPPKNQTPNQIKLTALFDKIPSRHQKTFLELMETLSKTLVV